jgi:hypothetical protein
VAQFLATRDERVHEVNPRWTAHRRRGLRRPDNTDVPDAQAVARLLREERESLPLVQAEDAAVASLQLWSSLRDDLVLDMSRLQPAARLACPTKTPTLRGKANHRNEWTSKLAEWFGSPTMSR